MDGVDAPAAIAAGAPALVFWTGSWGVLKGDRQILTIIGPDGSVFMSAERVLERNRATESRWIGTKRRSEPWRSEEHTSELQSLMRTSYAVVCLHKQQNYTPTCAAR